MFISRPYKFSLSDFNRFVDLALKSPVTTEQVELKSLIFAKKKQKNKTTTTTTKNWYKSFHIFLDLVNIKKKHFSPPILISLT